MVIPPGKTSLVDRSKERWVFSQDSKNSVLNKYFPAKYSQTSHKRPTEMQILSGRIWEVVVYKNWTIGGLFQEEVWAHLLYER